MNEEARKRLEYEEQFFGMSSQFFADSFKSFVKDELESKISMLVDNLKNKLLNQTENLENFELALKKMKQKLMNEYSKSLDELFPEISSQISSIIHIPPNVLLKEDLPVIDAVGRDISKLKEEIEQLEGTYKSLLYIKQEMLEELEEADSVIFLLEYILSGKNVKFDVLPIEEITALSRSNNLLVSEDS